MIKRLLFDYGGTLDTSARHWSYIIHEGYTKSGIILNQEDFREAYVYAERKLAQNRYILPNDDFYSLLLKKVFIEMEYMLNHDMWKPESFDVQSRIANEIALYCDNYARKQTQASIKILDTLSKKGHRMILVSNFYGNLSTVLRNYRMDHFFEMIVESAVVGIRKPSPDIYKLAVERAGVKPEECIVIGDSYKNDIMPATQIGCKTIWFKGEEWEDREYEETIPTHVITNLKEIVDLI